MEWSTKSKYNSFNSYKGLTYYETYREIVGWLNGREYLPPPLEVNLDPMAECNLNCYFCIVQRYLRHHREEVGEMRALPLEYMIRLTDFLAEWGVKGLCISGGGEPTLHKGLPELIMYAEDKMDVAVSTNATLITPKLASALMHCRWVALSIDSADYETYRKIKGKPKFNDVMENVTHLTWLKERTGSSVDFCFKFLLVPENQHQIYDACLLARDLGVQDFQLRPVDFERKDIQGAHAPKFDTDLISEQFAKCHELETEDFRVYTITHKFDSEFHVQHNFASCLAAPLLLSIQPNGSGYHCVEHKMEEKYRLGNCYPDPLHILHWWGSDEHRQLIKNVVPERDCSRCIFCEYHQQIAEVVIRDGMCRSFP